MADAITPNVPMAISACLKFVELSVLARSTETVSDTANRMDQRISLLVVHLAAQASDIDVNDIHRWIEMKIPDVLQQHPRRHNAVFVAHQIFQKLEFLGQKENLLAAPAGRPRDQVDCEIADAQDRLLGVVSLRRPSASSRANSSRKEKGLTR
jgi:hypothetical protein